MVGREYGKGELWLAKGKAFWWLAKHWTFLLQHCRMSSIAM